MLIFQLRKSVISRFWKICRAVFNPIWKHRLGWAEKINANNPNKWNRLLIHLKVNGWQYVFLKFHLSTLTRSNRMKINLNRKAEVHQMQAVVFLLTNFRLKIKELIDWALLYQTGMRAFRYSTPKKKQKNTEETAVSDPAIMAMNALILIIMTMITMVNLNLACRWTNPIVGEKTDFYKKLTMILSFLSKMKGIIFLSTARRQSFVDLSSVLTRFVSINTYITTIILKKTFHIKIKKTIEIVKKVHSKSFVQKTFCSITERYIYVVAMI